MEVGVLLEAIANSSGVVAVILILLSFIKIPKVELNLWGLLGKSLTKDVSSKIDQLSSRIDEIEKSVNEVESKLDEHIELEREATATSSRQRILRFNDEIINGANHTKEHYDDMIEQIDIYEDYCEGHPNYSNNKCMLAIANIKEVYKNKCAEKALKDRKIV